MARDSDTPTPKDAAAKTGFGPQVPLPLAERRRVLQPEKAPETPAQIYTDWALI